MAKAHPPQSCILMVDDFEPFRRFVCAILQTRPEWRVVAEASDGLQAVRKAEELHPDLILLDIGLPKLNGIEAAKIISRRCPESRILFVTLNGDDDVRAAAMRVGAMGYVHKASASDQLLDAITTVLSC